MSFPKGWGLIRSSNTQPVLVLRFEATDKGALATYQSEVMNWLTEQGVKV